MRFFEKIDFRNKKHIFYLIVAFILVVICIVASVSMITNNVNKEYNDEFKLINTSDSAQKSGALYYNKLSFKQQKIFDSISDCARKYAEQTDILPLVASEEDVSLALDALFLENPDIFYIKNIETEVNSKYTYFKINYLYEKEELDKMKLRLDSSVKNADEYIKDSGASSSFEVEVAIHDYIISVSSPSSNAEYTGIYGALVAGVTGGDGYAKAFKFLCNNYGIICHIVCGSAEEKQHAWNIVLIDDKYYNVDVCFDDSDSDTPLHTYLNVSDDMFSENHSADAHYSIPKCSDTNNYYRKNGYFASSAIELSEIIKEQLDAVIRKKENYIEFYCDFNIEESKITNLVIDCIKESFKYKLFPTGRLYFASYDIKAYTFEIEYLPEPDTTKEQEQTTPTEETTLAQ